MNRAPAETILGLDDCDENFETVLDAAWLAGVAPDFRRDHWAGLVAVGRKDVGIKWDRVFSAGIARWQAFGGSIKEAAARIEPTPTIFHSFIIA